MDSTLAPAPPIKASASKLPIKRKTPDPNPSSHSNPDPDPKYSSPVPDGDPRPPPFKFHRIWTEPDEIRFLQGLLHCASDNLSFPRDLNIFYARFSDTMSQPYTKSQLSEKLRRLRKKFRVISSRISKGLDQSFLSPHDRALFEISKRLWHPDYADTSPFGGVSGGKATKSDLVGVEVSFLPEILSGLDPNEVENFELKWEKSDNVVEGVDFGDMGFDGEVKLSEVNVEFEKEEEEADEMGWRNGGEMGAEEVAVAKAVIDAFDKSLEEVRMGVVKDGGSLNGCEQEEGKRWDFDRRWKEQRVAELDVLTRRMRLVFEQSLLRRQ
ncbi:probable transcription factor At5g28040 [Coffea eugenioides]|uniref:Glabrous enhancer-binding protein-like DBD domain-containing protein n=1 Tax=Coffea arabica TaxID=13443 RepID=A0A6P6TGV2_COFAR|nr:probable transcription factor At5g28040 [Coffea arabica]XP_027077713.1 probable transcription factor At5g28040 [Coffea arabica]XP_027177670.1 probable transcription factor At5g28040 [Coffea eugenioides]